MMKRLVMLLVFFETTWVYWKVVITKLEIIIVAPLLLFSFSFMYKYYHFLSQSCVKTHSLSISLPSDFV